MAVKNKDGATTAPKKKISTSIPKHTEKVERELPNFYICGKCGKKVNKLSDFVSSQSELYAGYDYHIPICPDCLEALFSHYCNAYAEKYPDEDNIEHMAIKRVCQHYNIYYSDKIMSAALKAGGKSSLISSYIKQTNLWQYKGKTYDNTIEEEIEDRVSKVKDAKDMKNVKQKTIKLFGTGYKEEDYEYLQEQYDDWTARHECKTKAQEEIFKRICFKQWEIWKATRAGLDTKDLDYTFQQYLGTAKLQPKQNAADTMSDAQTFGTLIDKYENTRPLPEIDEELRDVDKIGLYIDVFFRGHLSKMMGLKGGLSALYDNYIRKYTVSRPEYNEDSGSSAIHKAIFGGDASDTD